MMKMLNLSLALAVCAGFKLEWPWMAAVFLCWVIDLGWDYIASEEGQDEA